VLVLGGRRSILGKVPMKMIQYLRYVDCALLERAQRMVRERSVCKMSWSRTIDLISPCPARDLVIRQLHASRWYKSCSSSVLDDRLTNAKLSSRLLHFPFASHRSAAYEILGATKPEYLGPLWIEVLTPIAQSHIVYPRWPEPLFLFTPTRDPLDPSLSSAGILSLRAAPIAG
jgi:hypothetical protein